MQLEKTTEITRRIKHDFNIRLQKLDTDIKDLFNNHYILTKKMIDLFDFCSTSYYSAFHKVTDGGELNTINGCEGLVSFIGNFYDDASYKLVYRIHPTSKYMVEQKREILNQEIQYPDPEDDIMGWSIGYADDNDNQLTENGLIEFIDKIITHELNCGENWVKRMGGDWNHESIPKSWRDYNFGTNTNQAPYILEVKYEVERTYNKNYGDNRICICGHPYYRHFDTYEDMQDVGCKYCHCFDFVEQQLSQL